MAASALVDSGFLVALLNERDGHHRWAVTQASQYARPWQTCESVLSETFYLLGEPGAQQLAELLRRSATLTSFVFADHRNSVLQLMRKYSNVPMSLSDACLVRMTEILPDPVTLTTDSDFRIYRRHGRQLIPCILPA